MDNKINKVIHKYMVEQMHTVDSLAEGLKISPDLVHKWITGKETPGVKYLPQLAIIFNVTINELFGYPPNEIINETNKLTIHLEEK